MASSPVPPPHPRRAVCPGSFDPITRGHLDIITRASHVFDEVIVAVVGNPDKSGAFTARERVELIEAATESLSNVTAASFPGELVVDVCRKVDAVAIVKGLRSSVDFDYERPMAQMNRELTQVETVLLVGDPALSHYSSSLIRQVAELGGDVSQMVPEPVLTPLLQRVG